MQKLITRIRAGYAGIQLVTHEESRALDTLTRVAETLQRPLHAWSCATGLSPLNQNQPQNNPGFKTPIQMLENIGTLPAPGILILHDLQQFLSAPNPPLQRILRLALNHAKASGITLVLLTPGFPALPADIAKLFATEKLELPDRDELTAMIDRLCHTPDPQTGQLVRSRETPAGDDLTALLDAASGLTETEAEDACALSLVQHGRFDAPTIEAEKAAILAAGGLVEYLKPSGSLADVGGWDAYKRHLSTARHQFTPGARAFGVRPAKGDLFVGSPGSGKSLVSKILGREFRIATLRCRLDHLRDSKLGGTEANWRHVMDTARKLAPCLLFLDEIEGLLSGHASSAQTDGGTTATLVKAMLQDFEQSDGVFFACTANDIDGLPDPLIDRLNVWVVDLPNDTERGEIWQIHMRQSQRDAKTVCPKGLMQIVKATDGFSGRQIARVWNRAIELAYADGEGARDVMEKDILTALTGEVPTSKTMAKQIEQRRARLEGKAKPVTSATLSKILTGGKGRAIQAAG